MEFKTKNTNNDYEIIISLLEIVPPLTLGLDNVNACCSHYLIANLSLYIYSKYEIIEDKSDDALRKHITRFFAELSTSSKNHVYVQDTYKTLKNLIDKGQELYKEVMKRGEVKKQCEA